MNLSHPTASFLLYITCIAFVIGSFCHGQQALAQSSTAEVRAQLVAVQQELQKARKYFADKKFEEAGQSIGKADQMLVDTPPGRDLGTKAARKKLQASIAAAKTMLAKQGVKVSAPVATSATPVAPRMNNEDGEMATAMDEGGISFIKQIGPILEEKCIYCHGGDESRAGLRLVNFAGIQRGGNNGVLFRAPNTNNSLLLQRIKGEGDDEQMPPDSDPLTPEQIGLIEKWIAAGAPFDGGDVTASIPKLITQFEVSNLSHEELWKQRGELVQKNWDLGMPGVTSTTFETKNIRLMSTDAAAEIEKLAKAAESRLADVAQLLGSPSDEPLLKGGSTIYVVHRRYDYSEFGQMVEQRSLPRGSHGHWKYTGRDAFGVVLYSNSDAFAKDALVAEQVAGLALAGRNVPGWFAEGGGIAVAARLEPKDARVLAIRASAKQVVGSGFSIENFLANDLAPEESRLIAFGFVERLMGSKKPWAQLMSSLKDGKKFGPAFAEAYRGPPEKLLVGLRVK